MNLRTVLGTALFAICALAVAACGGGGSTYNAPTPGPTCAPGENVQIVYPIPGATGVPDATAQIVVAVASPLPGWNIWFQSSSTYSPYAGYYSGAFSTIGPSQVPTPAATPQIANPVYQSASLGNGSFGSGVNVYLWLNNGNSNCTPLGPLGSFTTQ